MRFLIFLVGVSLCLAQTAFSQANLPAPKTGTRMVTILSDATSDPNGAASQVLSEIAIALDKESEMRVLSLSGYGGATNARDLLQLRGADLAVVNNDVLAYLDLSRTLPEARRKVRLIAPLYRQRVFLFARPNVKTIEELKGLKVGVPSTRTSRGVTARTVFGTLKIPVQFEELEPKELAKRNLDAILLFESDLPDLKAFGIAPGAYRLLAIPAASGPLSRVYVPAKLGKTQVAGFGSGQATDTIEVSTLLATFDWNAKQTRYADVVAFVEKFFALLPKIRERNPNSPFTRTDVRTIAPGWQRFAPAGPLAASAPGLTAKEAAQAPIWGAETPPAKGALRLLALSHPPLTDARQSDGGVAFKLLTGALELAGVDVSVQWVDGEKDFLEALLANKVDAGFFWQTLNCDAPSDQTASGAAVCDRAALSEPIMLAVLGVFARIDTPLGAEGQEGRVRTLCAPESQPISEEVLKAIPWLKGAQVKLVRPKTVIDCIAALDSHETEALIALEPEGRFVIDKLQLSQSLQLSQRIAVPAGLHALVAKSNPRQAQLIQTINEALAKFRASKGYAEVIASHIADLTGSAARIP
jgi:ABC-type amino acid transport substrate-binding protein